MTKLAEQARHYVLEYFNAAPDEYIVIFTSNASGALKLVGEAYPFASDGRYLLTFDNHNSVNGIREFAWAQGADVTYLPLLAPELRVDERLLMAELDRTTSDCHNLFAYPAQSNFSGAQHPLEWISQAQARGWDVLLDAAAFVPTNRLDLSRWHPDLVSLSFYKIFGYPTGIGALLARKAALNKLRRPWFAGGTISIASVQGRGWHYLLPNEAGFEDGTINYLGLPAVEIGLRYIADIGIETIHARVVCLIGWLLDTLLALRHRGGGRLVRIYGPIEKQRRGGTIAFNFLDRDGAPHDYRRIEALAAEARISLRTGCFCNPGAGEIAHNVSRAEMAQCFTTKEPMSFDQFFALIQALGNGKNASTVRISVGLATTFADVYRFVQFARGFLDKTVADIGPATADLAHAPATRDAS